jgi:predicted nucleotidyltransferase
VNPPPRRYFAGAMVTRRTIREYARQVGRQFSARRVILFGSYVRGKPTKDSDVDLLVVMPHKGRGAEQATEIRLKFRAPFPMDLLVRSPQKIRQRLAMGDVFIKEIMENGEVLYEARHG